jgi:hypothetical protein
MFTEDHTFCSAMVVVVHMSHPRKVAAIKNYPRPTNEKQL